jgi:hypothetical protein
MSGENSQNIYQEVSESIKTIFDLTSRIDERLKSVAKQEEELDRKLDGQIFTAFELDKRLGVIESKFEGDFITSTCTYRIEHEKKIQSIEEDIHKIEQNMHKLELDVQAVEIASAGHENRWKTIITFLVQIIWVVLAAYILYKLGISSPNVP